LAPKPTEHLYMPKQDTPQNTGFTFDPNLALPQTRISAYLLPKFSLKSLVLLLFLIVVSNVKARSQEAPFGEVDTADLKLRDCSFEKSANAMILFDVAKVTNQYNGYITMIRHRRIKIFNKEGANAANIGISFSSDEAVKNIKAATYNLVNNKIEKTVIDKKEFFKQKIDKKSRAIITAFPNVKNGSIIEMSYQWETANPYNYPDWNFQNVIPTRYSEINAGFKAVYNIKAVKHMNRGIVKDTTYYADNQFRHVWAIKDVPSFSLEPYMHSIEDNYQSITFKSGSSFNSWKSTVTEILEDVDFGKQLNKKLDGEDSMVVKAKKFKSDTEKIAYLFDVVKKSVKWNKQDDWFTRDGIQKAWQKKAGNSTEVNLILYRLLKAADFKPKLMVFGPREEGEIQLTDPGFSRLRKTVVQLPLDTTSYLVLDATSRFNTYNNTPYQLLGLNMISIDPVTKGFDVVKIQNNHPSEEAILINAEILPAGGLQGSGQISSSNYKRIDKLEQLDVLGEKKYLDAEIKNGSTDVKLTNYKMSNVGVDTLPLREDFDFKREISGVDGEYIYFNPNIFTGIGENPFLSESRFSDIDYVYLNKYNINGHYKIPVGYKVDVLPRQLLLNMPDKSITFKRVIGEVSGNVVVHYIISFNRAVFLKEEYDALHNFYKKMYEMLNEPIVFKKTG
jgi:hypothetical protein